MLKLLQDREAVLLDVDGTLVDSNDLHVQAWDEAFRANGHLVQRSDIRAQIGKGGDQLVPAIMPALSHSDVKHVVGAHDEIFQSRYLNEVRAFPNASEFVGRLHERGFKIVLASSAKSTEIEHYIQLLDIGALVTARTTSDDVAASKPAADIFSAALGKIGPTSSDRAIAIGDTPYDVIAASRAGLDSLAVLSGGFSETVLLAAGAAAICEDVSAILAALK